jgi:F0F1-type ATP synthase assembly protein I
VISRFVLGVAGVLVGLGFASNGVFASSPIGWKVVMFLIGLLLIAGSLALATRCPKEASDHSDSSKATTEPGAT